MTFPLWRGHNPVLGARPLRHVTHREIRDSLFRKTACANLAEFRWPELVWGQHRLDQPDGSRRLA